MSVDELAARRAAMEKGPPEVQRMTPLGLTPDETAALHKQHAENVTGQPTFAAEETDPNERRRAAMDGLGELMAVAVYTFGSFQGWATDPLTEEEVREFVADPPEVWKPRPQDDLAIFRLEEVVP